jgi:hypothetical protein
MLERILGYVFLVIIVFTWYSWRYLEAILPPIAKPEQLLVTLAVGVLALLISMEYHLFVVGKRLREAETSIVQTQDISSAIHLVIARLRKVETVRFFVITGSYTVPHFSTIIGSHSKAIRADECNIKILIFDPEKDKSFECMETNADGRITRTKGACDHTMSVLKDMHKKEQITYDAMRYSFFPTEYFIIFDDNAMISGGLEINFDAEFGVNVQMPILIFGGHSVFNILGRNNVFNKMITDRMKVFESIWSTYKTE